MKKEKSVLHLCEGTLLALVILLIMDLYLLKFLQDPEVSYYPMLHLMEAALALLVVTLALSLIQRELLSRLIVKAFRDITGVHNKTSLEKLVQGLSNRPSVNYFPDYWSMPSGILQEFIIKHLLKIKSLNSENFQAPLESVL